MKPKAKKPILFLLVVAIVCALFAVPAFSAAAESGAQTAASGLLPLATTSEIQSSDTFVEAANKIKTQWSKTWGTETESGQ